MNTTKLVTAMGGIVGSYAGWWVGAQFGGIMTSFFMSMICTGVGLYLGRRIGRNYEV